MFTAGSKLDGQLGTKFDDSKLADETNDYSSPLNQVLPFGDDDTNWAVRISCGDSFTMILDESGKVWSFGKGTHGRLGHGDDKNLDEPKVIEKLPKTTWISAGCRHSAAISEKGELYTWGFNFYEQLGLGSDKDFDVP